MRSFHLACLAAVLAWACLCNPARVLAADEGARRADRLILAEPQRAQCLAILRSALRGDAFWPSMHAAEALGQVGGSAEVRTACSGRLAVETDDRKRCGLARELVRAGDRAKIAVLFQILRKSETYGHTHAAESLYKVAEVGDSDDLRAALSADDRIPFQLMAAATLARCGSESAMALIRRRLAGPDREGRKLAAWILGRLGDARDIPQLEANCKTETDAEARSFAENALAARGDAVGLARLRANLKSAQPETRALAAECVAGARLTDAAALLPPLLDDADVDVRVRAAQALLVLAEAPVDDAAFSSDVYAASRSHPRYSEGSVIALNSGRLLYATTEFDDSPDDFARAQIVGRTSSDGGRTWDSQTALQQNVGGKNVMSVTLRNLPANGAPIRPIGLFYLVKNGMDDLHVWLRVSSDDGRTFGAPRQVTSGRGYHVMNNDRVTILRGGRLLCPVSWSPDLRTSDHFVSTCFLSDDGGATWRRGRGQVDQPKRGAMEPEVIELRDDRVLMIVRTQLGHIAASMSADGGETWSQPVDWKVASPESPATLRRVPATGEWLLIWNPDVTSGAGHGGARTPLAAALSADEGKTWKRIADLESSPDRTYAYTSLVFVKDRALVTYYVADPKSGWISSRFRSLPLRRLDAMR